MNSLGFQGPFSGGKHQFMVRGEIRLPVPNPHQRRHWAWTAKADSKRGGRQSKRMGERSIIARIFNYKSARHPLSLGDTLWLNAASPPLDIQKSAL
jgi:hypothetical protein